MTRPGLWLYGGIDRSLPVDRSLRILDAVSPEGGRDFTTIVFPNSNHSLIPS